MALAVCLFVAVLALEIFSLLRKRPIRRSES